MSFNKKQLGKDAAQRPSKPKNPQTVQKKCGGMVKKK